MSRTYIEALRALSEDRRHAFGHERGLISRVHAAWRAGELPIDDIHDHLEGLWLLGGTALEGREMVDLLRATGPIVGQWSEPWTLTPTDTFSVYQGRCRGEPLGIGWTPAAASARDYANAWHKRRVERDGRAPDAVVCRATTTPALVLLRTRKHFVIDPSDLTDDEVVEYDPPPPSWVRLGADFRLDDGFTDIPTYFDGIGDVRAYFGYLMRSYVTLARRLDFDAAWCAVTDTDVETTLESVVSLLCAWYRQHRAARFTEVLWAASQQ